MSSRRLRVVIDFTWRTLTSFDSRRDPVRRGIPARPGMTRSARRGWCAPRGDGGVAGDPVAARPTPIYGGDVSDRYIGALGNARRPATGRPSGRRRPVLELA